MRLSVTYDISIKSPDETVNGLHSISWVPPSIKKACYALFGPPDAPATM